MRTEALKPLESITSSSKGAHALGEPDARFKETKGISGEKIDSLTWLVEQLSNSLSETRHRQTRLAEVLEQSLTSISRNLSESETRVQQILDERLSRFEQTQNKESETSDRGLGALSARLETETELNRKALCDLRESLEAMERTLALSETRVEERLDERLSRIEQARDKEPDASDETLGALGARLDLEAERNENALSDLRAAMEAMERAATSSEAQIEEKLDERLGRIEQARDDGANASEEALNALGAKLDTETERNANTLLEFRASLETMEKALAASEARVTETLSGRLSRLEEALSKGSKASNGALKVLAAQLQSETERNANAFLEVRASLEAMEQTLAASQAQAEERLDDRLGHIEQARNKESEASGEKLNALDAKLDRETERNGKALSDLRAMLGAMERTIASSEARAAENFGGRLTLLEQAGDKETELSEEKLNALGARLDAETERNEAALVDCRASLEILERNFAKLESQIADAMKGGLSLFDQAKKQEAEALRGIVEELMEQGSIRQAIEMHWKKKKA